MNHPASFPSSGVALDNAPINIGIVLEAETELIELGDNFLKRLHTKVRDVEKIFLCLFDQLTNRLYLRTAQTVTWAL